MIYKPKSFDQLYGIPGFSDQLLKDHFTLYEGYVKNTNLFLEKFNTLQQEGKEKTPEYGELKRRFGWEFNGMRLHEYYFGNLKKDGREELEHSEIREKMANDFGSVEAWEKDFKSSGLMRGIGWVVLAYDPAGDRLLNLWINEHDTGHCAGLNILLVMDVFEHAYIRDYGLKKENYVDAFFKAINWQEMIQRFQRAPLMHETHR